MRYAAFLVVFGLLAACDRNAGPAREGLTPLTAPTALDLRDVAYLADPPPGAHRVDCRGEASATARGMARAETATFGTGRAKLIAWGMRTVGRPGAGGSLWTLESEVTDPASGAVQIVQRDYLMGRPMDRACAFWPIAQKVLEWRRGGSVGRAGEGRVLIE